VGCLAGFGALAGVGAGVLLLIVAFTLSPLTAAVALAGALGLGVVGVRRLLRRWDAEPPSPHEGASNR